MEKLQNHQNYIGTIKNLPKEARRKGFRKKEEEFRPYIFVAKTITHFLHHNKRRVQADKNKERGAKKLWLTFGETGSGQQNQLSKCA